MGFESSNRVGLASLVLLLLGMCCAASGDDVAAVPNLKVANNLNDVGALIVVNPRCCCIRSPSGYNRPLLCPRDICQRCDDEVVEEGRVGMLDAHVGPYPLPYLMIQVKEKVYCVEESDLKFIKAWDTLVVGPGACGPRTRSMAALQLFFLLVAGR